MIDYYGTEADYIHLKFGDARKAYYFTDEFREKHPNFCGEYEMYWEGDKACRFKSPLEIAQYVDLFDIPVTFYFNYTDTVAKDMAEVYAYFIREYSGISVDENGDFRSDYDKGLDGEEKTDHAYKVVKE